MKNKSGFIKTLAILTCLPMLAFGQRTLTLDGAIAESMDYFSEKLPAKAKIAVLKVEAPNMELIDYITVECENYIKDGTSLVLANKKALPDILKRNNIADINKVDDLETLRIARQLGVDAVILVEFSKRGENYRFFAQAFGDESSKIIGMQSLWVELDGILATLTGETYLTPEQKELAKVKKELEELKARTSQAHKIQVQDTAQASSSQKQTQSGVETKVIKGIECVLVKAGTFMMGDGDNRHKVTLTKDYYISKYPITQAQYKAVTGTNPSYFKGDNLPVETISWYDAVAFCEKVGGRLPTEAEWEFAARGGNNSKNYEYSGSNDINQVAWYRNNSGSKTRPVGQKSPNELGIYDMSGNVWEWVNDWYGSYPNGAVTDPTGPVSGSYRVDRGGSWYNDSQYCRVALRAYRSPSSRNGNLGLRVAFNSY